MTPFYAYLVVLSTVGVGDNLDRLLLAVVRLGSSGASNAVGTIVTVIGLHLRGLLHLLVWHDEESRLVCGRKMEGCDAQSS